MRRDLNGYRSLIGGRAWKLPLERTRCSWEDNIKWIFKKYNVIVGKSDWFL
jgi:hypothetical protein